MKEKTKELADSVGAVYPTLFLGRHDGVLFTETELETFVGLIAAHKAEVALAEAYRCGVEAGTAAVARKDAEIAELKQGAHVDGILRVEYGKQFDALKAEVERLKTAVAHEREACAKLETEVGVYTKHDLAAAINEGM